MRLLWFSTFPRFELVDRHGFAACSPACEASDLLNGRAARRKLVAGTGIEPARRRLMRPLPSHLAPPRFEKWHGVSVPFDRLRALSKRSASKRLPRARRVLETLLRKLAPAVL